MSHDHPADCPCCSHPGVLTQSLEEVGFQSGLWGHILRGADRKQVRDFLTSRGRDLVNKLDPSGYAPLLYAARSGDAGVCEELLECGADVHAATPHFLQTALHRAAQQGNKEVVEVLLAHGADLRAQDRSGKTPFDLAVAAGHQSVAQLLSLR